MLPKLGFKSIRIFSEYVAKPKSPVPLLAKFDGFLTPYMVNIAAPAGSWVNVWLRGSEKIIVFPEIAHGRLISYVENLSSAVHPPAKTVEKAVGNVTLIEGETYIWDCKLK